MCLGTAQSTRVPEGQPKSSLRHPRSVEYELFLITKKKIVLLFFFFSNFKMNPLKYWQKMKAVEDRF